MGPCMGACYPEKQERKPRSPGRTESPGTLGQAWSTPQQIAAGPNGRIWGRPKGTEGTPCPGLQRPAGGPGRGHHLSLGRWPQGQLQHPLWPLPLAAPEGQAAGTCVSSRVSVGVSGSVPSPKCCEHLVPCLGPAVPGCAGEQRPPPCLRSTPRGLSSRWAAGPAEPCPAQLLSQVRRATPAATL